MFVQNQPETQRARSINIIENPVDILHSEIKLNDYIKCSNPSKWERRYCYEYSDLTK